MRKSIGVLLAVALLLALAGTYGLASTGDRQVRVLSQGDAWQVEFGQGEYAYQIEYLDGNMFVTVEAQFLASNSEVVYAATHTLVQDNRMSALRVFQAERVADGQKASGLRFHCDSGKARVSFGPAKSFR
ncbi:MAG: hypothetical protein AB7D51_06690 [Desulfovibrionaceae bacterium]|jgi:hypothetical protein